MAIDLVIVTATKPPGSSTSISPLAAILEIAPAKVLQGAVRLHGLASSPTPETQVRVAWACAADERQSRAAAAVSERAVFLMSILLCESRDSEDVQLSTGTGMTIPSVPGRSRRSNGQERYSR